jgi:hypothetical protein
MRSETIKQKHFITDTIEGRRDSEQNRVQSDAWLYRMQDQGSMWLATPIALWSLFFLRLFACVVGIGSTRSPFVVCSVSDLALVHGGGETVVDWRGLEVRRGRVDGCGSRAGHGGMDAQSKQHCGRSVQVALVGTASLLTHRRQFANIKLFNARVWCREDPSYSNKRDKHGVSCCLHLSPIFQFKYPCRRE